MLLFLAGGHKWGKIVYHKMDSFQRPLKICVVTTTRADYGLLHRLLWAMEREPEIELRLVASGTHLLPSFGMTASEIEADGLSIDAKIPIVDHENNSEVRTAQIMAKAMERFADYFQKKYPDMLVVLGDRYEVFAVSAVAAVARIPIAHIHGGETTEGILDEAFRHCITKMSYLHFTACEAYRRRVIQLGEAPERVFNVGALGVENALHTDFVSLDELCDFLQFPLGEKPYAVVTFHPVTLESNTAIEQMSELAEAMTHRTDLQFLVTKSNADTGGEAINRFWDNFARTNPHCYVVASLGARRYLSALKYASFVLGNSSSGIVEVPAFGIPTINIGDRQRGRMQAESIINCEPVQDKIAQAINTALSQEFRMIAAKAANPFGNGETSKKICRVIMEQFRFGNVDLKKKFYDLNFSTGE